MKSVSLACATLHPEGGRVCAYINMINFWSTENVKIMISSVEAVEAGKAWTDDEYKRPAGEMESVTADKDGSIEN